MHPLLYFHNNVVGSLNLLNCMASCNITNIIFSSSASVYGIPEVLPSVCITNFIKKVPIDESSPLRPISPYGETKIIVERLLHSLGAAPSTADALTTTVSSVFPLSSVTALPYSSTSLYAKELSGSSFVPPVATIALHNESNNDNTTDQERNTIDEQGREQGKEWSVIILRYFNPCGAHPSGLLGECPKDTKNANLMPTLAKVSPLISKNKYSRVGGVRRKGNTHRICWEPKQQRKSL